MVSVFQKGCLGIKHIWQALTETMYFVAQCAGSLWPGKWLFGWRPHARRMIQHLAVRFPPPGALGDQHKRKRSCAAARFARCSRITRVHLSALENRYFQHKTDHVPHLLFHHPRLLSVRSPTVRHTNLERKPWARWPDLAISTFLAWAKRRTCRQIVVTLFPGPGESCPLNQEAILFLGLQLPLRGYLFILILQSKQAC